MCSNKESSEFFIYMYYRRLVTTAIGCRLSYSLCADTITGHDRWIVRSRSNTSLLCC